MTDENQENKREHFFIESRYGFLILLVSLISTLVIPAYFHPIQGRAVSGLIIIFVLLSSLYLVAYNKREFIIGLCLGIPILVSSILTSFITGEAYFYIHHFLVMAFMSYISFHIFRYLFESTDVSLDMICAALCLYLMLGLIWTFIYLNIELYSPGSFSLHEQYHNPKEALPELLYFSYVTLSTLGFGDIVPLSRVARSWATLEAILGQFYLAFVVARLVGLYITSSRKA